MPSIKEIAKKAGVSPSTVSRVLNNPDYHCSDAAKRDRIWKAAIELNYTPNEAARNLRRGSHGIQEKTYFIHILMTRTERSHTDPFYTELLHVVESQIHRHSCILANVWYMSAFSNEKQCRKINLEQTVKELYTETENKCDGLIIIGKCTASALTMLGRYFKNVVSINRNPTNHQVDEVTCDGSKIATLAVEHLLALGHASIGYVGPCHGEARYKGYMDTLRKNGLEQDIQYIWESRQTETAGYEIMEHILSSENIPTGIYCANDITAVGMLKALTKSKLIAPISIISSDDIEQAQFTSPMLTTVALPKQEMGKFAVYLLLDRIKGEHQAVTTIELEGKLVQRESCFDTMEI